MLQKFNPRPTRMKGRTHQRLPCRVEAKRRWVSLALLAGLGWLLAGRVSAQGGIPLWTNRYSQLVNGVNVARAMAVDASGNVIVTGYSGQGAKAYDYATIKYSGLGVPLWTNIYNGPGNDFDDAKAVAVDNSGNVFVTG